jgi:hypothetical protein
MFSAVQSDGMPIIAGQAGASAFVAKGASAEQVYARCGRLEAASIPPTIS